MGVHLKLTLDFHQNKDHLSLRRKVCVKMSLQWTLQLEMQQQMRMFRAQRNFYIVGFALFLSLVIKRLLELILINYSLEVEKEAVVKQAENASKSADSTFCAYSKSEEIKKLKEKIENARNETKAANLTVEEIKAQSEELEEEYKRLMAEEFTK
eukprot:TRINITY_DN32188_c0_g1_i1.p1 TRINITY_DN32188_c0_g1~~TRINITY_DN32188_c0_g1_i1.p1  ORF type:complete len:154 (+),score=48.36 TRINITY_DN32188_c0_g1_i1:140-601(+)